MTPNRQGIVYLRDANTIQMVMAFGVPIDHTVREGSTLYFGFQTTEASAVLSLWNANQPIPIRDGRMFILAQIQYKAILRRELGYE